MQFQDTDGLPERDGRRVAVQQGLQGAFHDARHHVGSRRFVVGAHPLVGVDLYLAHKVGGVLTDHYRSGAHGTDDVLAGMIAQRVGVAAFHQPGGAVRGAKQAGGVVVEGRRNMALEITPATACTADRPGRPA